MPLLKRAVTSDLVASWSAEPRILYLSTLAGVGRRHFIPSCPACVNVRWLQPSSLGPRVSGARLCRCYCVLTALWLSSLGWLVSLQVQAWPNDATNVWKIASNATKYSFVSIFCRQGNIFFMSFEQFGERNPFHAAYAAEGTSWLFLIPVLCVV